MRRLLGLLLAALALQLTAGAPAADIASVRAVIGYTNAGFAQAAGLEARLGARRLAAIPQLHADVVELPTADADSRLALFRLDPAVRWAERDGTVHASRVPNDALLSTQWSLTTTRAEQAWDLATGAPSVVVAVIDTGTDASQPDLQGKLVPGHDYVNGDDDPSDDNGHGTAVAGVVAATTDNRIGVAGYCWQCRVMPVKVLGADGSGFDSDVAQGIVWATDHGAKVLNLSLGGPADDTALDAAAQYAYSHGVLVVAAAGNESLTTVDYPAAIPNVLSVGASDRDDRLYSFSNAGAAVAAPGENSTTGRGNTFVTFLGTSSAAPVVSGIAGLMFGSDPGVSPDQVRQALEATAKPVTGVEFGRVDAYGALTYLGTPPLAPPAAAPNNPSQAGSSMLTTRVWSGRLTPANRSRVFTISSRAGLLRATLKLRRRLRVRLRLLAGRTSVASARGVGGARLRARTGTRPYRLALTAAGRAPVAFRLTATYAAGR